MDISRVKRAEDWDFELTESLKDEIARFFEYIGKYNDKYKRDIKVYGGAMGKFSILINNELYMLKIENKIPVRNIKITEYTHAPSSEYIGCHIFELLGFDTQKTFLGIYNGKSAVACKDFMQARKGNYQLQPFNEIISTTSLSDNREKEIDVSELYKVFNENIFLNRIKEEGLNRFWDTFIVDTLISNRDRHTGNWAYITNLDTKTIELAPIYDCGSSLFNSVSDLYFETIMRNKNEKMINTLEIPHANIKLNNVRVNYRYFLNSHYDKNCDDALIRIVPRIDMNKIKDIVNKTYSIGGISKKRCEFLKEVLEIRYEQILIPAYKKALKLQREPIIDNEKSIIKTKPKTR